MDNKGTSFYLKVGERYLLNESYKKEYLYVSLDDDSNTILTFSEGSSVNKKFLRTYNVIELDKSLYVIRKNDYAIIELGLSDEMIRSVKGFKRELNEYSFNDYEKEQFIKEEYTRKRVM
jgi:hypothetical protein